MNAFRTNLLCGFLILFSIVSVHAEETLDTLLPPPFFFRKNAEQIGVDAVTRERIEKMYKAAEPEYHKLKAVVEQRTLDLYKFLVADQLDEEEINQRMKSLLDAESKLKLYQVHVRITLLSQVSAKQRQAIRDLATGKKPDVRKDLGAKVEAIRRLSEQYKKQGGSLRDVQKQMAVIQKSIDSGNSEQAAKLLDELIKELKKSPTKE